MTSSKSSLKLTPKSKSTVSIRKKKKPVQEDNFDDSSLILSFNSTTSRNSPHQSRASQKTSSSQESENSAKRLRQYLDNEKKKNAAKIPIIPIENVSSEFEIDPTQKDADTISAVCRSVIMENCCFFNPSVKYNVIPYHALLQKVMNLMQGDSNYKMLTLVHKKMSPTYANIKKSIKEYNTISPFCYVHGYFISHPSKEIMESLHVSLEENNRKRDEYHQMVLDSRGI